jgi:hypothetical protein
MNSNSGKNEPHDSIENTPSTSFTAVNLANIQLAGGMKLSKWREIVGMSSTTAWRLRRAGKLPVIVRYGVAYVTAETIKNFFTNDGSKTRKPHQAKKLTC